MVVKASCQYKFTFVFGQILDQSVSSKLVFWSLYKTLINVGFFFDVNFNICSVSE